jgi:hypothetical protein
MMRLVLPVILIVFALGGIALSGTKEVQKSREAYTKGVHSGDYYSGLLYLRDALRWRPSHPDLIYTVAALEAKNGNALTALNLLQRVADMGLFYHVAADSDFVSLLDLPQWLKIQADIGSQQ